jgi:hypothetical protein
MSKELSTNPHFHRPHRPMNFGLVILAGLIRRDCKGFDFSNDQGRACSNKGKQPAVMKTEEQRQIQLGSVPTRN